MCVFISRSLHAYFTTFDVILKYILTYNHTCKNSPPIIPINPVKQYTKFKMRDMFLFLLSVGVVGNVRSKKLEKR